MFYTSYAGPQFPRVSGNLIFDSQLLEVVTANLVKEVKLGKGSRTLPVPLSPKSTMYSSWCGP